MAQQDSDLSILQVLHSEYRESLQGINTHIHTFIRTSPVSGKKRRVSQKIANIKLLIHNLELLLQSAQKILRRLHEIDYIDESQANVEGDKQSDALAPEVWFDNLIFHLRKSAQQVDRATQLINQGLAKSGFKAIEITLMQEEEFAKKDEQAVTIAKRETTSPPVPKSPSMQINKDLQVKIDELVSTFFHSKNALKYFDEVYLYRKELIDRTRPLVKNIYHRKYPGYLDVHSAIGDNVLEFIVNNDENYANVNCLTAELLGRIKKEKVQHYKTRQLSKMAREKL